jgi:hypothetical protein
VFWFAIAAPAHCRTAQLQIRLFDDAMVVSIKNLLGSGDESKIKTAMGVLSSVINHSKSAGFS